MSRPDKDTGTTAQPKHGTQSHCCRWLANIGVPIDRDKHRRPAIRLQRGVWHEMMHTQLYNTALFVPDTQVTWIFTRTRIKSLLSGDEHNESCRHARKRIQ